MNARRVLRSGLALVLAALSTGCATWGPAGKPIDQVVNQPGPPDRIALHLKHGGWLVVTRPVVHGDSLYGQSYLKGVPRQRPGAPVAVAVADVDSAAVEHIDGGKTLLLLFGVGAFVFLIAALASWEDAFNDALETW